MKLARLDVEGEMGVKDDPFGKPCALCGENADGFIGPVLALSSDRRVVCESCGREFAPSLVAIIELAAAAESYILYLGDHQEKAHAGAVVAA